jgi:Nif-specific regulatory protein
MISETDSQFSIAMPAELIVVSGTNPGARLHLAQTETLIGRAPASNIRIDEPECGWRHCVIRRDGEHFDLIDLKSPAGTTVNGARAVSHRLTEGDQIGIGRTRLLFTLGGAESEVQTQASRILLQTCSLLFLFKALAEASGDAERGVLESQILRLIGDLVPSSGGAIALGGEDAVTEAAARAEALAGWDGGSLAERVLEEGIVALPLHGLIAAPIYVRGRIEGIIALLVEPCERARIEAHRDSLAAITTIAAAAFESQREVEALRVEKISLEEKLGLTGTGVIGQSMAIRRVLDMVRRVAPMESTVLITGESGTGKELVARAIHNNSPRRQRPFLAINCAAIAETLLESELFGHERGSFTGAIAQKKGKFELADQGTVFLDEIGEMTPGLQAKLLRVLQQREFERVGGTRTIKLDVRVLAATNRDLAAEVRKGNFREDLFHRLNVVSLRMPALRERPEDILPLAHHFLRVTSARCGRKVGGFSPEAEACLLRYSWPGNVRELENAIERAVVLGEGEMIEAGDLPESVIETVPAAGPAGSGLVESLDDAKREAIVRAWAQARGNYRQAAETLGLHPNSLLRLIRKMGLREELRQAAKAD